MPVQRASLRPPPKICTLPPYRRCDPTQSYGNPLRLPAVHWGERPRRNGQRRRLLPAEASLAARRRAQPDIVWAAGSSKRGSVGSPDRAALREPQRHPDAGPLRRALRRPDRRPDRLPGSRVRLSLLPGARRYPAPRRGRPRHPVRLLRGDRRGGQQVRGVPRAGVPARPVGGGGALRHAAGPAAGGEERPRRDIRGRAAGRDLRRCAVHPHRTAGPPLLCRPGRPHRCRGRRRRGVGGGGRPRCRRGGHGFRSLPVRRPDQPRQGGVRRQGQAGRAGSAATCAGPRTSPGADWTLAAACYLLLASVAPALFFVRARDATGYCSSGPPSGRYPRRGRRARRGRRRPPGRAAKAPRSERWRRHR